MRLLGRYTLLTATTLLAAFGQAPLARAQPADTFPVYATDACSSNPWLIPFDQGSAELSDFARKRLDGLVAAWHVDAGPVLASGRIDGAEEGHSPDLSKHRLEVIVDALTKRGMPAYTIWTRDDGADHGFVQNLRGVSEPQNRIVLLTFARGGEQCSRNLVRARAEWVQRNCSLPIPTPIKQLVTMPCPALMSINGPRLTREIHRGGRTGSDHVSTSGS